MSHRFSAVTAPATILFVAGLACTSSSDDHGHDDVDAEADAVAAIAPDSGDLVDSAIDGADAAVCAPACAPDELCCVDAHGHFPTCRKEPSCP